MLVIKETCFVSVQANKLALDFEAIVEIENEEFEYGLFKKLHCGVDGKMFENFMFTALVLKLTERI